MTKANEQMFYSLREAQRLADGALSKYQDGITTDSVGELIAAVRCLHMAFIHLLEDIVQ